MTRAAASFLVAALVITACGGGSLKTVHGFVDVPALPIPESGIGCDSQRAIANRPNALLDVAPGTTVTVTDQSGTVVALTHLGGAVGTPTSPTTFGNTPGWTIGTCSYPFVAKVPRRSFLGFQVAQRDIVRESWSQVQGASYVVHIGLGR